MNTKFTLEAGRCIVRDGNPFATIHGVGQYDPCEIDKLARQVATLPELVAALELMLSAPAIVNCDHALWSTADPDNYCRAQYARAALAKVNG